ncbi:substrate-binding periplasmic protein [Neptuniibacter sp. PT34_22]|uniref:substrate-binding periplasmic protein n=2 Tax=unclassified Neptuniibacter TaxID=2630693 RepID=UPI0039F500D1
MRVSLQKFLSQILIFATVSIGNLYCSASFASTELRTIPPQSDFDVSHNYFVTLLQMMLDNTSSEYGHSNVSHVVRMEQGRAFYELKRGEIIDVYWAGTSIVREEEFTAIRIPLLKGLLGYRLSIIREDSRSNFQEIRSLEDLRKYTACQGRHWPDSDILESAGIAVRRGPIYELMFGQLAAGRCDFFPRGIHEGGPELTARREKYPNLRLFSDTIVYYPFPMYFFVRKGNIELAKRLELGLERAINSGEFDQLLETHPITSTLFPLTQWGEKNIIAISNPLLPRDTPVTNSRYWIRPDDLKAGR